MLYAHTLSLHQSLVSLVDYLTMLCHMKGYEVSYETDYDKIIVNGEQRWIWKEADVA
jgi:hypothetical protein